VLRYGLRGIRSIRFENESDGRFDSRFDSNEKKRFAGPSCILYTETFSQSYLIETEVKTSELVKQKEQKLKNM